MKAFTVSPSRKLRRAKAVSASLLSDNWDVSVRYATLGDSGTYFRFMAQARNPAALNRDEKTIIFNFLYAALDFLAFLEVRQGERRSRQIPRSECQLDLLIDGINAET